MAKTVDSDFTRRLRVEFRSALRSGIFATLILLSLGFLALAVLGTAFGVEFDILKYPMSYIVVVSGSLCLLLWLLRQPDPSERLIEALLLLFVSSPGWLLILIYQIDPTLGAVFFQGPISVIYFLWILFAGLVFRFRIALAAGVIAMGMNLFCFFLVRPVFLSVESSNEYLTVDQAALLPNTMKSVLMLLFAFLVGLIFRYTGRIFERVITEETEKEELKKTFGTYVSEEIREKVLRLSDKDLGERTRAAILFSDIRGFTGRTERSDPELVMLQLNEYFDEMVQAVQNHGGVVDKFIGDAIMVSFGGVKQLDSPARAAVAAALEMRARLKDLNARWELETGGKKEPFRTGIGIHYAEVVQGVLGSKDRKEYTVLGDGVNVAARIESLTKKLDSDILISRSVSDQLDADAVVTRIGRVQLRGRQEPVELFALPE